MTKAIDYLKNHRDVKVRGAAEELENERARQKRIATIVQEALSQLRLDMKYLLFDLECTRQERDALKGT